MVKKMRQSFIIDERMEVSKRMEGLKGIITGCGRKAYSGRRSFAGLLMPVLVLALALILPGAALAGTHEILSSTDSSPANLKTGYEELMVTLTSNADKGGNPATKAICSIGGVPAAEIELVTVYYGGALSGSSSPTITENFPVTLGSETGGSDWTFYVQLKDGATGSNVTFTVTSIAGTDSGNLPIVTASKSVLLGCQATSPTNLALQAKTANTVTFNWSYDSSNNDRYILYRNSSIINTNVLSGSNPYVDQGQSLPLDDLTKYAYIINGYEILNSCESKTESNTLITQTLSTDQFTIESCGGCHTTPPDDAPSIRGTPDGATIGRHANPYHTGDVTVGEEVCVLCHNDNFTVPDPAHRDGLIQMNTTAIYGQAGSFYDKDMDDSLQPNGIDNDFGHGSRGQSPIWGSTSGNTQCTICHGMGDNMLSKDTEGHTAATDEQVGAHDNHLHRGTGFVNISTANACTECHLVPAGHNDSGHYTDGDPAEMVWGALATNGSVLTPSYDAATGVCTNTYCHDGRNFRNAWSTSGEVSDPSWSSTTYLADTGTGNCTNKCHGYPPAVSHTADTLCSDCHLHVNSSDQASFNSQYYKHIDGIVDGLPSDCTGCHDGAISDTGNTDINSDGVRDIMGELALNSHHITTAVGSMINQHCSVCHGEGDSAGATNTMHKNGQVDLRDVDSTTTWAWTGTQHDNMDLHCMSCHDSDGATATGTWAGGTASNPFNDTLTNAYDQVARSGPLDVVIQFATTNYSHHAVLGQKYTGTTYMRNAGLMNGITEYTPLGESMTVRDTSVLNCGDCHTNAQAGVGAHGSNNEYLLMRSSADGVVHTTDAEHTMATYVCYLCHTYAKAGLVHGSIGQTLASCLAPTADTTGIERHDVGNDGNITGISCTNCHNVGKTGWGGIHGGNNTYTLDTGTVVENTYRFMPGMGNTNYLPGNWSTTSGGAGCYTNPDTAGAWGGCVKHTGKGISGRTPRPLAY
jgi:hypothetical protein